MLGLSGLGIKGDNSRCIFSAKADGFDISRNYPIGASVWRNLKIIVMETISLMPAYADAKLGFLPQVALFDSAFGR